MILSQREKYIAVGVSIIAVIFLLDWLVYAPLHNWSEEIASKKAEAETEARNTDALFVQEKQLTKVWDEMKKGGLQSDISDAQNNLYQAVSDWAHQSIVDITKITPQQPTAIEKSGFVQVPMQFDGTGTTSSVAKFLYQIEVAKIPVRIHNIQISSTKDGVDNLHIVADLTTLCLAQGNNRPSTSTPVVSSAAKNDAQ